MVDSVNMTTTATEMTPPPAPAPNPTAQRLVAEARAMLDEQGLDGLTLRAIARRAGVSHGAPLRHFPTLAVLLSTVAAQGFRDLIAAVDAETATLPVDATALVRLSAAGRAYVYFATNNPGVFTIMFRSERLDPADPVYVTASIDSFLQLQGRVEDAQREGFHPDVEPTRLASVMWTTMHGLADLWVRGCGLPGADETFGLDEFIALSHTISLGVAAEPSTTKHRRNPS
jgi:AcrR family transcriptional regulator